MHLSVEWNWYVNGIGVRVGVSADEGHYYGYTRKQPIDAFRRREDDNPSFVERPNFNAAYILWLEKK